MGFINFDTDNTTKLENTRLSVGNNIYNLFTHFKTFNNFWHIAKRDFQKSISRQIN